MHRQTLWTLIFTVATAIALASAIYFATFRQADPIAFFSIVFIAGFFGLGINAYFSWLFATERQRHPKNKSIVKAFQSFFASKPSRGALWQITDGKLTETRASEGELAAPAQVIIPKDYAIVFEDKTGKFTHAEFGPAEVQTHSTDDLGKSVVVVTRPRFKRLSIQNVTTRDGVLLERIDFSVFYHLKTDANQYRTGNIQFPISQDTLTQAVYAVTFGEDEQHNPVTTWETAVQEAAKNSLRTEIASVSLVQFYTSDKTPAPTRGISELARKRLNEIVSRWGISAEALEIMHIVVPTLLQKKLEEQWIADRSLDIKKSEGIAEGRKIEEIERSKGKAWDEMLNRMRRAFSGSSESDVVATSYIQIMQYLDTLLRMSQSSPERTVIQFPQHADSIFKQFEDRLQELVAQQAHSSNESPTASATTIQRTPNATFVGTPTSEGSPPGEEEVSSDDSAASGTQT